MLYLLACHHAEELSPTESTPATESLPTSAFRFAVLADTHVYAAEGEHRDRLRTAVDWLNSQKDSISLVLLVGDIAWGDGLPGARAELDRLLLPWVPINGDNEVQLGSEEAYATTFADHYVALAGQLEGWQMGAVEVQNPEEGVPSWFHNVSFRFEGLHFLGLDWASRKIDPLLGETGMLHDFPGGTYPWFEEQLSATEGAEPESVVLFSHIPMHPSPGGFDVEKNARIQALIKPYGDRVWADLAGHYHVTADEAEEAGYHLYVTDAVWDDSLDVRLVDASFDGRKWSFVTEVTNLPFP